MQVYVDLCNNCKCMQIYTNLYKCFQIILIYANKYSHICLAVTVEAKGTFESGVEG